MRTRLSKNQRRDDILSQAKHLIISRGLGGTGMEDIRVASGISRGGLYHHFPNLSAVLQAIVETEVTQLAQLIQQTETLPILVLLHAGSNHLGGDSGVCAGVHTNAEKLEYLAALDNAFSSTLSARLGQCLGAHVRPGVDPHHVAELFLAVNSRLNRHEILGHWSPQEAAQFAATALFALAALLKSPSVLDQAISDLSTKAQAP